ncbi:uncharacterized protein LOC116265783 [Nymphaea colorata]|nr:uncharacterized protein LOC116265783 [Nymphaea colorata]XP_031502555.1 uncharacterized protein LOC116265783 [Nymphaea colorata]XP_031502556.1 uncharacterized protein LOC116265783 [Nymphaea colorata]XP_031502557.1 uncharacterized protein LOC116265783 [Nymphaea colorata]XP_031502559.1 uncharacterized protein LOC116265783 [Nymphaea colorata]XP_031502560.1 uncharacterized protein LOC116265783 [Nymphaea colorata]XP_049936892.1 uncharacterized protein LOC116265783 [Nymphaea colorata]XP_04993689
MSSFERESDLCTDKSVIEVSPDLVVCCKEGPDHVIKDICVDEGLPSKKNIFVENSATDKKENLVHFDVDDLSVKDIPSILDDFAVHSGGKQGDHSRQFVLPDCESIYDDDLEKSLIGGWPGRIKYIACEKLMSKQSSEVVTTSQSFVAIVADSGIEQQKDNQVRTQEETTDAAEDSNCKTAKETANSISGKEMHNGTTNTNPKLPEPQTIWEKEKKTIDFRDGHHDSHTLLEHGLEHDGLEGYATSSKSSMCTLDEVSAADSRNPSTNTKDLPGNMCHALAEHGTECIDSAGLGASSQGSLYGNNESNGSETRKLTTNHVDMSGNVYPGTNPASASIAYSGPAAYSGSISLRSDSSTTSVRSFAFPILSSEWNASPVKMAAADPKQLRKHRGWRMALLCCRF